MKTFTKTTLLALGAVVVFGASDSANAETYYVVHPAHGTYYHYYAPSTTERVLAAPGTAIRTVLYSFGL